MDTRGSISSSGIISTYNAANKGYFDRRSQIKTTERRPTKLVPNAMAFIVYEYTDFIPSSVPVLSPIAQYLVLRAYTPEPSHRAEIYRFLHTPDLTYARSRQSKVGWARRP